MGIPSEATSISSEMNGDALEWEHGPQTDSYRTVCVGGSDSRDDVRLSVPIKSQRRHVSDRSEQMALYSHFLSFSIMETEVT